MCRTECFLTSVQCVGLWMSFLYLLNKFMEFLTTTCKMNKLVDSQSLSKKLIRVDVWLLGTLEYLTIIYLPRFYGLSNSIIGRQLHSLNNNCIFSWWNKLICCNFLFVSTLCVPKINKSKRCASPKRPKKLREVCALGLRIRARQKSRFLIEISKFCFF